MSDFTIFKTFRNLAEANGLIQMLEEEEITFSLIENTFDVDITFTGNTPKDIQLLIQQKDFEKVNQIIENQFLEELKEVDKNHYLFQFSKKELFEVIEKKEEWCTYDYLLAKQILKDRGVELKEEELKELSQKRMQILAKPTDASAQIVIGYVLSIFGFFYAVIIGDPYALGAMIIGFIIGINLWRAKKSLPNGEKINRYTKQNGEYGMFLVKLTVVLFILAFIFRFYLLFG